MAQDQPSPFDPGGFDFEKLRKMLEQLGLPLTGDFERLMQQFGEFQGTGFPGMTNADLDPDAAWRTTITAAKQLSNQSNPTPAAAQDVALLDAERLAQSWLDQHTEFAATGSPAAVLSRSEWIEETSQGWRGIVDPIIQGLSEALQRDAQAPGQPREGAEEFSEIFGPMLQTSASLIYRDRLKRVLSEVAASTLTGTEIGINLLERERVVVLTSNLSSFTADLELPEEEVTLYLTLREAARIRLFSNVGWLSAQLTALLSHYAREIQIDFEAISDQFEAALGENPSLTDLFSVGEQVHGSFFQPASTPTQLEILERLEVLLALIEGWVDHVVERSAASWLANASQLTEIIRRRRASKGPVQDVFGDLIGLQVRPRLVRDAQSLWAALDHHQGTTARDAVWRHPDLLPVASDLADPLKYAMQETREPATDPLDEELRKLLDDSQ